jgi:hypothetical protein
MRMNFDFLTCIYQVEKIPEKGYMKTAKAEYENFSLFIDFEIEKYKKNANITLSIYHDSEKKW